MIELQQFDLNESLQLLRLNSTEVALLKEFKPIVERDVDQIVDRFYGHILSVPNLRAIIERHSSVEKLRVTLKKYLLSIYPDRVDEQFMVWRVRIGEVHNRIGLPPFYYLSANQVLIDELLPRIMLATKRNRNRQCV